MLKAVIDFFYPALARDKHVRDASVWHHLRQIERRRLPQVDSEILNKNEWAVNLNQAGKYNYDGNESRSAV